jgi:ABC-type uncharacterized transport system auxiliary subunit
MKTFKPCLLLAAVLAATACVSVIPQPETPRALYRIGAVEASHRLGGTLLVREPEASRLFSGRDIAAEDASGALRIVRGVQWTDSATRMMQVALLDSLGSEGRNVAMAAESGAPADYELVWRISDFTLMGNEARCRIEATILQGRGRGVLSQANVATTAIALGNSAEARAKALTDAGRACVGEVAAFVSEATTPGAAE